MIMPVHSLHRVSASSVGLQFPRSCASPFLCTSTVHDSLHVVGVLPVILMSTMEKVIQALSAH